MGSRISRTRVTHRQVIRPPSCIVICVTVSFGGKPKNIFITLQLAATVLYPAKSQHCMCGCLQSGVTYIAITIGVSSVCSATRVVGVNGKHSINIRIAPNHICIKLEGRGRGRGGGGGRERKGRQDKRDCRDRERSL